MLLRAHQHVFIVLVKLHMTAVRYFTGIKVLGQHLLNRVVFVREARTIVTCCDCSKVCYRGSCSGAITDMVLEQQVFRLWKWNDLLGRFGKVALQPDLILAVLVRAVPADFRRVGHATLFFLKSHARTESEQRVSCWLVRQGCGQVSCQIVALSRSLLQRG